MRLELVWVVY
ncbi:hypothetical protein MTR67_048403 [Solanum verrucosum]|uniref:Uncharacterized protein n=1 Tax=Solanum verrucosum TaxID=315347 RepID=A0AAF0V1E3_SOLVR|nr:hypothetical protein MTR67_048403 [Solanum verrucosum]